MTGNYFLNVNNTAMIGGVRGVNTPDRNGFSGVRQQPVTDGASFADELKKAQSGVKFSKHAEMRLKTRNIDLSADQKEKLSIAIDRAGEKGLRDTLVIMDSLAMVANVKNRTIVTAVDSGELKQNVFTNIDGAVFA
ncbi:MAG: flagellar biosynthesis protein [Oscillospiraceae bacterium]|nr:flagellar biosynthesis protein [Oscillospiraceae bacterium]